MPFHAFPEGSDKGQTKAKPEIWKQPTKFKEAADKFQAEAAKLKLLEMQQNGELAQLNADVSEGQELTKRLEADMGSDSWLAKNIRPLTLIFILAVYTFFAFMSMLGHETRGAYVELLGQWGMLVMTAYFGGRSFEKIMEMKNKK